MTPASHHLSLRRLWYRELDRYPSTGHRYRYLALIALSSVVLYYELYVTYGVLPLILPYFHMSFLYYMNTQAIAFALGAIGSLVAGISDRWGRANLVVWGLGIVAVLVLFAAPNVRDKVVFVIVLSGVGFVEGAILVATAAIMRDFSPQIGRAAAMGMWAIGPVLGSLTVSLIATHTLGRFNNQWQSQFRICGWVGIAMFAIALLALRELSPGLRDQAMVTTSDRKLVEARSSEVDVEAALTRPWRQMLRWDLILSAFLVSIFLLIYYAGVSLFTLFYVSVFRFTTAQANGINVWAWSVDAVALVLFGALSDWLKVRKPLMIVGAILTMVFTVLLLLRTGRSTSYYHLVILSMGVAASAAVAYPAWMAGFTEMLDRYNPALTATGLALWGWILRGVVTAQTLVIPHVITSVTTLVDNQSLLAKAQEIVAKHPHLVAIVQQHQALFAELAKYPNPALVPPNLLAQAIHAAGGGQVGIDNLLAIQQIRPELLFLQVHQAQLQAGVHAVHAAPSQWQHWYWVCIAGQVAFLGAPWVVKGRWNPLRARGDLKAHAAFVREEIARIQRYGPGGRSAPAAPS